MSQLNLRTFTVIQPTAPQPLATPIVPLRNGCGMAAEALTTKQRDAAQRAMYRPKREASAYTSIAYNSRAEVFRSRLMGLGARPGTSAVHIAGRLLREHGAGSRRVLVEMWRPDWPVARSQIDALLSRAGVVL